MYKVGMADLKVCKPPYNLTTIGLGSCVGIALYDPITKTSGLAHVMLPDSTQISNNSNRAKFADTAISDLYDQMLEIGAKRSMLIAKIAGGAKMFGFSNNDSPNMNIGQKNVDACKKKLKELGVRLLSEDTGLNYGRTVELYSESGDYIIKAVGRPQITI